MARKGIAVTACTSILADGDDGHNKNHDDQHISQHQQTCSFRSMYVQDTTSKPKGSRKEEAFFENQSTKPDGDPYVVTRSPEKPRRLALQVLHLSACCRRLRRAQPRGRMTTPVPKPKKYVEQWPFGLYLGVLGHYFTYFGGLGTPLLG